MRYGFVIDHRKCIGCHACTVACKEENRVPLGVNRTWVKYIEKGEFPNTRRHFAVLRCNHCDNPPCVFICPTAALFKRSDGIVDFNQERCIGCKSCMQACPYDALYLDPETQTAAKCHFCAHRVEVNLKPACEIVCPEEAIISGDLDDPTSKVSQIIAREVVQVRKPEQGTYPKLYYLNADSTLLTPGTAPISNTYLWAEIPDKKDLENSRPSGIRKPEDKELQGLSEGQGQRAPAVEESDLARKKFLAKLLGEDGVSSELSWKSDGLDYKTPLTARTVYDVNHPKPWGGKISLYIWTKSIASGTFLLSAFLPYLYGRMEGSALSESTLFKWGGPLLALIFLAFTTVLLIADLKRPERFFFVLTKPQWRSWLTRGAYILVIYGLILSLWFLATLMGGEETRQFPWTGLRATLFWPGIIFAAFSAIYTGFLFGQAEGRDFWQSPLMPVHLLIQAMLAGAATLLLLSVILSTFSMDSPRVLGLTVQTLNTLLIGSLLLNAFIILAGELLMPHPNRDIQRVVRLIIKGPYKFLFWGGVLFMGHMLPLSLLLAPTEAWTLLGLLLSIFGILGALSEWTRTPRQLSLKPYKGIYWIVLTLLGFIPLVLLLSGNISIFTSPANFLAPLLSLGGLLAFEHVRVMAGQSIPLS
ncbi:MAG TPA: NrfD/PsrC family molybdoenzyme membrane anchor subunit [Candidatus Limnocylindrales bacterium]|nr:NrfD/PsrC family molybdoenzyme membrane anchor subunit [Candidatus Limnocylindrales bacterium]